MASVFLRISFEREGLFARSESLAISFSVRVMSCAIFFILRFIAESSWLDLRPRGISSLVVISSCSIRFSQLRISRIVMGDSSTIMRSSRSRSRILRASVTSSSRVSRGTLPISDRYMRIELETSGVALHSSV